MTIKTLLSIAAVCSSASVFAQTTIGTHRNPFAKVHGQEVVAKTTAVNASRCIGIVYSQYGSTAFYPTDSEFYSYSGSRGGTVMNQMKYDNGEIDYMMAGAYTPQGRYTQTFDANNNLLVHTQLQYSSTAWTNSYRSSYTYDANNNAILQLDETWDAVGMAWVNYQKNTNTYTAANKLASQTLYNWNGTSWDNYAQVTFTYNAMNNMVASEYWYWNATTMSYDPNNRDTMQYDASNNMISDINQSYDMGTSTWVNNSKYTYSNYLAPGCFQTYIDQTWNGSAFGNAFKDTLFYNSYNQISYYYDKVWTTANTWGFDSSNMAGRFYYELYTSGISDVNNLSASLELYPNPTTDIININFNTNDAAHTNLSVLDMTGRALAYIDEKSIKSGANSIQWSAVQLPAGVYLVQLYTGNGQEVKRFTVCK